MLSGFNTNFRYRGVLFHVQTEDSGLENPHIISHLFHGGNIMASEKRDYSDLIAEQSGTDLETAIRKLMEGQHKSMLKQLSRGEHDPTIAARMGPDVFREADSLETPVAVESPISLPVEPTVLELPTAAPFENAPENEAFAPSSVSSDTTNGSTAPARSPASSPISGDSLASAQERTPAAAAEVTPQVSSGSAVGSPAENPSDPSGSEMGAGPERDSRLSRVFGERVVSEKPLDEVVLDYLIENARKRRRSSK